MDQNADDGVMACITMNLVSVSGPGGENGITPSSVSGRSRLHSSGSKGDRLVSSSSWVDEAVGAADARFELPLRTVLSREPSYD